jgi:hypothetical protein
LIAKDQQREGILKNLREVLKDARQQRGAAQSEVQNLKRKRAGSTSTPPSQIKLLVKPQPVATQQHAPLSPARTEFSLCTAFRQKIEEQEGSMG